MNRIKLGVSIGLTCLMLIGCQQGIRDYIGAVGLTRVHADELITYPCIPLTEGRVPYLQPSPDSFVEHLGRSIRRALYASAREVYEQGRAGKSSASDRGGNVGTDDTDGAADVLPETYGADVEQYSEVPESDYQQEVSDWIYYGNCRITHYDDCEICCGVAGNTTASGVYPTPHHTVATGEDLPFGTELMINGEVYVVEDRGVGPYEVDVFVEDHVQALNMGMYYTDVYVRY